jgi:hypothetical protein
MTSLLQFPNMEIWFKMDLTQSHLNLFQIFSIVFPFLLIELRHRVSLTLYSATTKFQARGEVEGLIGWSEKF